MRGYIGMGSEPAAQQFCEQVHQAVKQVNPPAKKSWLKWLTG
jgi:hypothetical protein